MLIIREPECSARYRRHPGAGATEAELGEVAQVDGRTGPGAGGPGVRRGGRRPARIVLEPGHRRLLQLLSGSPSPDDVEGRAVRHGQQVSEGLANPDQSAVGARSPPILSSGAHQPIDGSRLTG